MVLAKVNRASIIIIYYDYYYCYYDDYSYDYYLLLIYTMSMLGKCFIKAVDEKMEFPSSNDVLHNGITFMCVLVRLGGCVRLLAMMST